MLHLSVCSVAFLEIINEHMQRQEEAHWDTMRILLDDFPLIPQSLGLISSYKPAERLANYNLA